ncbi:hypothetical protein PGT21_012457 [Puccinia graminis f. sp. tritici]|uniref:Uncharacterized protein n=1 Tax=Puccinia graminis f. sp. tritici TaxID=56615 RepID=A0A5B0QIC3_PUCGR|nr:hypothetical protein PGT21_012457 [Puccinia graminis f. sp. tritici]
MYLKLRKIRSCSTLIPKEPSSPSSALSIRKPTSSTLSTQQRPPSAFSCLIYPNYKQTLRPKSHFDSHFSQPASQFESEPVWIYKESLSIPTNIPNPPRTTTNTLQANTLYLGRISPKLIHPSPAHSRSSTLPLIRTIPSHSHNYSNTC